MNHIARTVAFKPGERNIFFHILTACNLSCSHCYINPAQHGSQTLSKETIEKWLELFVTPDAKTNVIFLG
ncbi:MAG: radical SAM protein, partial [Desulfobulbaceae bacterium]